MSVLLTREPLDLPALQGTSPADGALCLFVGVVRNENAGRPVRFLEYEAYEAMALGEMERLEVAARARFPVTEVAIAHRLGRLEIGEASVAVAVASPHRAEAFAACRFVIDTLKATVPIWKKEHFEGGAVWIEGPGACAHEGPGEPATASARPGPGPAAPAPPGGRGSGETR